jgi:hypothetical protein
MRATKISTLENPSAGTNSKRAPLKYKCRTLPLYHPVQFESVISSHCKIIEIPLLYKKFSN